MLTQMFNRRDAETPRQCRMQNAKCKMFFRIFHFPFSILGFVSLCLCVSVVAISCSPKPADLRAMMPGDSLVYLESTDLGAVMQTITDRPAFREAAKSVPDFSALNGVKLAVAVTDFETKEEPVTEENSNLKFIPHFVAAIETNAWNFQANSFTENQLGEFVNHVYGGEVVLESYSKNDGRYYEWKTSDGRKAYALVQGSVIFFANDESSIDKCLAVKRGEAESIAKNAKITDGDRLAFGYVSPDGVAQLSSILGMYLAIGSSEQDEIRQFVSHVVPKILRNSIEEVTWTSTPGTDGIEDTFNFHTRNDLGKVFAETLRPSDVGSNQERVLEFVPAEAISATRYDLKDPQLAWRTVVLSAGASTDHPSADVVAIGLLQQALEPYGVEDEEMFLSSVRGLIHTVRFDPDDQEIAVIGTIGDRAKLLKSVAQELKTSASPVKEGDAEIWRSEDGFTLAVLGDLFVLGDSKAVEQCLVGRTNKTWSPFGERLAASPLGATSLTISRNSDAAARIGDILTEKSGKLVVGASSVGTHFKTDRIERREVSDFGLVGWIITQFGNDDD